MVITIVTFLALIVVFGMYSIFNQDNTESNDGTIGGKPTGVKIRAYHPNGNSYVSFIVDYDGEYMQCNIVGTKFQHGLENCVGEFEGTLVPEPDNKFSRQAVKVVHENGTMLGYVPESYDGDCIRNGVDLPCRFHGMLKKGEKGYYGIVVVPRPRVGLRFLFDDVKAYAVEVQDVTEQSLMKQFRMSKTEATDMMNKMVVRGVCSKSKHGYYTANGKTDEELEYMVGSAEVFDIVGINFRGLTDQFLGLFDGLLYAERDNEHDQYAVSVFKGSKHVGYIPRDNKAIWLRAIDNGGTLKCTGYINKGYDDDEGRSYYYGEVRIINK